MNFALALFKRLEYRLPITSHPAVIRSRPGRAAPEGNRWHGHRRGPESSAERTDHREGRGPSPRALTHHHPPGWQSRQPEPPRIGGMDWTCRTAGRVTEARPVAAGSRGKRMRLNLGELLGESDEDPPRPCHEAQVMELRALAERYDAGCPFKPGDLVTPRAGYNIYGAGEPHIVLETPFKPVRPWTINKPADIEDYAFGERVDMRTACLAHGDYVAFWAASWKFMPWTGEAS